MFSSPILEKGSRFSVQYWEKAYRFTSPVLEKGSIGSPVPILENVIGSKVQNWEKVL